MCFVVFHVDVRGLIVIEIQQIASFLKLENNIFDL